MTLTFMSYFMLNHISLKGLLTLIPPLFFCHENVCFFMSAAYNQMYLRLDFLMEKKTI